jgi:hypothetical protein
MNLPAKKIKLVRKAQSPSANRWVRHNGHARRADGAEQEAGAPPNY